MIGEANATELARLMPPGGREELVIRRDAGGGWLAAIIVRDLSGRVVGKCWNAGFGWTAAEAITDAVML